MPKNIEDKEQWQCRVASSLGGGFSGTPNDAWGTKDYTNVNDPTVFFGLYGLPDFYGLWRHSGRKAILWAGSDIRHFMKGYWLDEKGKNRLHPGPLARWISKNCENYVENTVEQDALKKFGIKSKVVPSFLGNVDNFKPYFEPGNKVYTSISGDDYELYGWDQIRYLAYSNPGIEFHLYGNIKPINTKLWGDNVFIHGRVSQEQFDRETREMQGALRLTKFDGFSEILAKSVLWGQWPISLIEYPQMNKIDNISSILKKTHPNIQGRNYYLNRINKYPWNQKQPI